MRRAGMAGTEQLTFPEIFHDIASCRVIANVWTGAGSRSDPLRTHPSGPHTAMILPHATRPPRLCSVPDPPPLGRARALHARFAAAASAAAAVVVTPSAISGATSATTTAAAPPTDRLLNATVLDVIGRGLAMPGVTHHPVWQEFIDLVDHSHRRPRTLAGNAVLANMVAVLVLDDHRDYKRLVELHDLLGAARLARLQNTRGRRLDTRPAMPRNSAFVARLLAPDLRDRLADAWVPAADDVAGTCARVARLLVLAGIDPDTPAPRPATTVEDAAELLAGGLPLWRQHLAAVARNPWRSSADLLADLATRIERPGAAQVIRDFVDLYREESPSPRLSSCSTGGVAPSDPVPRIGGAARSLRERRTPPALRPV